MRLYWTQEGVEEDPKTPSEELLVVRLYWTQEGVEEDPKTPSKELLEV